MTNLLELLLLTAREIEHLFCTLEQHCALRFRLGDVECGREDGHFCLLDLFHDACR